VIGGTFPATFGTRASDPFRTMNGGHVGNVIRAATRVLRIAGGVGELLLRATAPVMSCHAQGRVLRETAHRPWPLPSEPWLMAQTWENLLFAHWRVPPEELRALLPKTIPLDLWEGSAYVGVTPFRVGALRLRGTPHLGRLTAFPELNVRTYSTLDGKPGIWFMSLDAANAAAVTAARRAYRLPYFRADMEVRARGESIGYRSRRVSNDGQPVELAGFYRPVGVQFAPTPGSLEHWLTERYCLYTLDDHGAVLRADIHHPPWPLRLAQADFELNTMAEPYGLKLDSPPLLHFATRQDVLIWPLVAARPAAGAG
jgi:uncharacterized protein